LLSENIKIKIYRTIILPVVLYVCETWLLTLSDERRLRAFENRVLRRIFGPKREEVTDEWRTLHDEVLNDLYCSPNNEVLNDLYCSPNNEVIDDLYCSPNNEVLNDLYCSPNNEVLNDLYCSPNNEVFNDLYCSPNNARVIKSRRMRWAGHVARMGERRGVYRVLVENPEGKRPLGRPSPR
jgi:hypothetical protein